MANVEKSLLARLTDTAQMARAWDLGLREEVFEEPIHRAIYVWMVGYWLDSHMELAPSWTVMDTEFPSVELDRDVAESTEWLVEKIKQRYMVNQAQRILRAAATTTNDDPIGSLDQMWRDAYGATQSVAPRLNRMDMATSVEERRRDYARRHENREGGVTLGLTELDRHTRGLLPGELAAVAGFTKTGKSMYLSQVAAAARCAGHTPLVMTLEMSPPEIGHRIDALYSGVSYARIQDGTLSFDEARALSAAQEELREMGSIYIEQPPRGERTVRHMASRARQIGADYLIVDQLSFVDGSRDYTGERAMTAKHGDIIFDLKDEINQATAGKIPCLIAVQLNRDSVRDRVSGGRGGLANFAHSSMIEQTVDLALGLWRNSEMRENMTMVLDIMGSRRSDTKSWLLNWHLGARSEISVRSEMT